MKFSPLYLFKKVKSGAGKFRKIQKGAAKNKGVKYKTDVVPYLSLCVSPPFRLRPLIANLINKSLSLFSQYCNNYVSP